MPTFKEYSSDSAYFIAGGETLEIIKKFEEDAKNYEAKLEAISSEYGAHHVYDSGDPGFIFTFHHKSSDPALAFDAKYKGRDGNPTRYLYKVNKETPEGKTLQERLRDMPMSTQHYSIFAKRLTGATSVATNPDGVYDPEGYIGRFDYYSTEHKAVAASYRQYGDVYVVEVPRVIHGINIQFNEAAKKCGLEDKMADGFNYDWFTPPDSQLILYSDVIKLQEKGLGKQTQRQQVKAKLGVCPPDPNRY